MNSVLHAVDDPPQLLSDQDAHRISNDLLVRSGLAIMEGDFDAFAHCFHLPHEIETFAGSNLIETRDGLREVFRLVRHRYVALSVTELARFIISAEYTDETTIKSAHESRLMNGKHLVQEPFPCFSVIRRIDGIWRVANSSYAIADCRELQNALMTGARNS